MFNRKGYYYTADENEIEIEDNHYNEIDHKSKKNWQRKKRKKFAKGIRYSRLMNQIRIYK